MQAVVFALVALSWIKRVGFPYDEVDHFPLSLFWSWYQLVGWAAVDNAVFALGQALLWGITTYLLDRGDITVDGDETEPLLST